MSSSASCVEYMMDPFGLRIAIGSLVARLLLRGESMVKKWAVLPVSAIATVAAEQWWESTG